MVLGILFFLFALNDLDKPSIKLMLTSIGCLLVFTLVWVFRGVYKKWSLNIIESSSILNLGLLSVITNYILNHGNSQSAQTVIVSISAGLIFVMFTLVTGYQGYKQLTTSLCWKSFVTSLSLQRSESQQALEEPLVNQTVAPTSYLGLQQDSDITEQLLPVIQFDKYRDSVFKYEDKDT